LSHNFTLYRQMHEKMLLKLNSKRKNTMIGKLILQSFKPGDQVFLLKGPKPDKFGDQYTGAHKVLEILNRNNVRIKIRKNSQIVHPNRLRISHIKPASNKKKGKISYHSFPWNICYIMQEQEITSHF